MGVVVGGPGILIGWVWVKIGRVGVLGWLAGAWKTFVEGAPAEFWLTGPR